MIGKKVPASSSLRTPSFEPALGLEPSNGAGALVTDLSIPVEGGQDIFFSGGFDADLYCPEDLSFPFCVPSPKFDDDFPHLPWPTEVYHLDEIANETPVVPNKRISHTKEPLQFTGSNKRIPYANCPFEYQLKRGPTVNAYRIYQFLNNRSSWKEVNAAGEPCKPTEPLIVRVSSSSRDIIIARIHGMLYRLVDRSAVPRCFPSLETIQSCFKSFHKSFLPLYPIVHPTTFSEIGGDNDQDSCPDTGLFLTTIMALGCLVIPVKEARAFSIDIAYLIRFAITDNAFQDETYLSDKWVLSAWVMVLVFSAWSGINRHMEISEAFKAVLSVVCQTQRQYASPH
jgi:hypothetical protein